MSRLVLSALLVLAFGCRDEKHPGDAATADAGTPHDGSVPLPDGHVILVDSGTPDDGSVDPDGGGDVDPDGGNVDPDGSVPQDDGGIGCPGTPVPCSPSCPGGMVCITTLCGTSTCAAASLPCNGDGDCATGSACTSTDQGDLCQPTNGEVCNDARDCPIGHECEGASGSRTCESRRIPCDLDERCPIGYLCEAPTPGDGAYCVYLHRSCAADKPCDLALTGCIDVDGNGQGECASSAGGCATTSDCSGGLACGYDGAATPPTRCMAAGLCNPLTSGQCGASLTCVDLRGEGLGQCASAGSCTSHADCGANGICAIASGETAPQCFSGM